MQGQWMKPAKSGDNGGDCVAVRETPDGFEVCDTKDPHGPVLKFTRREWEAALDAARTGEWIPVQL